MSMPYKKNPITAMFSLIRHYRIHMGSTGFFFRIGKDGIGNVTEFYPVSLTRRSILIYAGHVNQRNHGFGPNTNLMHGQQTGSRRDKLHVASNESVVDRGHIYMLVSVAAREKRREKMNTVRGRERERERIKTGHQFRSTAAPWGPPSRRCGMRNTGASNTIDLLD